MCIHRCHNSSKNCNPSLFWANRNVSERLNLDIIFSQGSGPELRLPGIDNVSYWQKLRNFLQHDIIDTSALYLGSFMNGPEITEYLSSYHMKEISLLERGPRTKCYPCKKSRRVTPTQRISYSITTEGVARALGKSSCYSLGAVLRLVQ